jgi:hypothetical protein
MIARPESDAWRTVVSGDGYRSSPVFLSGGRRILYAHSRVRRIHDDKIDTTHPEPAIADLASGREQVLSLGKVSFYAILSPQKGADSAIYFIGIAPRDESLEAQIVGLGRGFRNISPLPYRLSVRDIQGTTRVTEPPELAKDIASIPSEAFGQFEFADGGHRLIFSSFDSHSRRDALVEETLYLVEDGNSRLLLRTLINIKRIGLSGDGRTILILGDPYRSARGLWDFFLFNSDTGALRSLPLLERISAAVEQGDRRP